MPPKFQHYRSTTPNKRPDPGLMLDGQMAQNQAIESPGAFIKDAAGGLVKIGPTHVGPTAPNSSPAGTAGNSIGETWLNTSLAKPVLNVWNGVAWIAASSSGNSGCWFGPTPPAEYEPGSLWWNTGDGNLYIWDGSQWVDATPNPTPAHDGCYVGDTPPAGAQPGWLWWNSAEGRLYVWYDDGDTQQWVEASPGGGGGGEVGVSTDANNSSKLGSDGLIFTPFPAGIIVEVGNNYYITQSPSTGTKAMNCWGGVLVNGGYGSATFPKPFSAQPTVTTSIVTGNFGNRGHSLVLSSFPTVNGFGLYCNSAAGGGGAWVDTGASCYYMATGPVA